MKPRSVLGLAFLAAVWTRPVPLALAQPNTPQLEHGVDRPGGDYRSFDLAQSDPRLCQTACLNDSRCRAWTFVKPGQQGPGARCWLKDTTPVPVNSSCCTSGFINALREIQSCREIGNVQGSAPVTCVGEGGRDYGTAGKTFREGDRVMILARFTRLLPGRKELTAIYSRSEGGRFLNFSQNKKVMKFENKRANWAYWFPAHFTKPGRWRVSLALTGAGLTGQVLGYVDYCVNCALE